MVRLIRAVFVAFLAFFIVSGCTGETPVFHPGRIGVQAGLPSAEMTAVSVPKVSLADEGESLSLAWSEGDQLRIIGNATNSLFDIREGFTAHNASFFGDDPAPGPYTILLPGKYPDAEALGARDCTVQTQRGNGSTAHLEYNACLTGVTDISHFAFTPAWAGENGATLKENSELRIQAELPGGIRRVTKLVLHASSAIFPTSNEGSMRTASLTLQFEDLTLTSGERELVCYLDLGWAGARIPAGATFTLTLDTDLGVYSKSFLPPEATLTGGKMYTLRVHDGFWSSSQPFAGGSGTQADPYLIANYIHMNNMGGVLADNQKIWFKLISDVDMDPADAGYWAPLNTVSGYGKAVDIDGGGHTVRNLHVKGSYQHCGMFGILNGDIHDIVFEDPTITDTYTPDGSNHDVGILCGYAGYASGGKEYWSHITHVTVKGASISTQTTLRTGGVGFGILTGTSSRCVVSHCRVDGARIQCDGTRSCNIQGGVFGRASGKTTVEYTTVRKLQIDAWSYLGGIAGYLNTTEQVVIDSCSTSGLLSGNYYIGGILGGAAKGSVNLTLTRLESDAFVTATNETSYAGGIMGGHAIESSNTSAIALSACTSSGSVSGMGSCGGILGAIAGITHLYDCRSHARVVSTGPSCGGIAGRVGSNATAARSVVRNCFFDGTVEDSGSGTSNTYRYIGGIVGVGYNVLVEHCLSQATLRPKSSALTVGGVLAYCSKSEVQGCEWRGSFATLGQNVGGIVAAIVNVSSVHDNLCAADVAGSTTVGGASAYPTSSDAYQEDVYHNLTTGSVTGTAAVGGVMGRMGVDKTAAFSVYGNIVWSDAITGTRPSDQRSSAAMIGEVDGSGYVLRDNYHKASLVFTDGSADNEVRFTEPYEQPGTWNTSHPLTWTSYQIGGADWAYYQPYHGVTTALTATAQAQALGWSTEYWDFSGAVPALKNLPPAE